MNTVIVVGAHLGYDLSTTPLGGGGTVGTHLVRRWAAEGFPLLVIGSGPVPPTEGVEYVRIHWESKGQDPSSLSVREYARFCEQFSRGVAEFLRDRKKDLDPSRCCIVHHDIAEAPDFALLKAWGFRQVGIFHVDVVDYVARIYLRNLVSAPTLATLHRGLARARLHRFLPTILRLIFTKQEECVRHCDRLVVPSHPMAEVLARAYPQWAPGKVDVVPWGAIADPPGDKDSLPDIRERYGIPDDAPVLLTLSRISPEKGQDLLLKALRIWERRRGDPLFLFICGAPAYMHGRRYFSYLKRLSRGLKRVKVCFPGYVAGAKKRAFLKGANLYVFPSRHESYGLTLAEALAAGLPVLATDHHAARELLRPEFGTVVAATPKALYEGLVRLLSDRKKLEEMGKKAREFSQTLSFAAASHKIISIVSSLFREN